MQQQQQQSNKLLTQAQHAYLVLLNALQTLCEMHFAPADAIALHDLTIPASFVQISGSDDPRFPQHFAECQAALDESVTLLRTMNVGPAEYEGE